MRPHESIKANLGFQKSHLTEKARPDFREPKVLYIIFFDVYGPITQNPVPKGVRMTGEFYAENFPRESDIFYIKRRIGTGARGIKLSHDNVRPHMSKIVREIVKILGFK